MNIIHLDDAYRGAVNGYIRYLWGGPMMVTRGRMYDTGSLPGFVAVGEGMLLGAALYRLEEDECEVSALLTLVQGQGIGRALLDAVVEVARREGTRRVWLVTTNDNTGAIRFYQRYGLALKAVHIDAMEAVRRLKGEIPSLGNDGIPILHEFEFELMLGR